MTLRPSNSPQAFLGDPVDRFSLGRSHLAWCHRGELVGSVVWARPSDAELKFLMSMWDLGSRLKPGYEAVTDVSLLEALEVSAFETLNAARLTHPCGVTGIRRHVLVCQTNSASTLVAGFYSLLPKSHARDVFTDRASAFASLDHADAAEVLVELEAILATAIPGAPVLRDLADFFKSHLRDATLMAAARKLGRSVRTLQRDLLDEKTSFREERDRARAHKAEALIRTTTLKLSEIAEQVGCSSPSQLSKLVRRLTGISPSALRKSPS
jgi:AraC-like DNA-binding protein